MFLSTMKAKDKFLWHLWILADIMKIKFNLLKVKWLTLKSKLFDLVKRRNKMLLIILRLKAQLVMLLKTKKW